MFISSDLRRRLNFFRFAIIVITISAFAVSIIVPIVVTAEFPETHRMGIVDAILPATVIALLTGLIGFMAYFAYSQTLLSMHEK